VNLPLIDESLHLTSPSVPAANYARTSFFDSVAGTIDSSCKMVFLLIQLELGPHPIAPKFPMQNWKWPSVLRTSESTWRYLVFAVICHVSIHLESSATVPIFVPFHRPQRVRHPLHNRCLARPGRVRSAQTHTTSWLGALKDAQIGEALTRMHADVAKRWKVEHLASGVGMSRTTFCERFRALVGVPPLEYLIHWRMMIARDALKNGRDTLSDIAMRVGYASETSFSAAFKNAFGQSPGRLRSLIRSQNAHQ
jgi:AraC-like DNA-binding protein